jgi:hypothetical protein
MYLVNVREGDFIPAGMGFKGPNKWFKVTLIEWSGENSIMVHTEGGFYEGAPYSSPGVLRRVNGRWEHY